MNTQTNSYGLYDAPVRSKNIEEVALTEEEIREQYEKGAFVMTRAEAIAAGFLNPHDEQDTHFVDARS